MRGASVAPARGLTVHVAIFFPSGLSWCWITELGPTFQDLSQLVLSRERGVHSLQ